MRRGESEDLVLRRREAASKNAPKTPRAPPLRTPPLDHPSRHPLRGLLRMRARVEAAKAENHSLDSLADVAAAHFPAEA
jgi:hypothetical protein